MKKLLSISLAVVFCLSLFLSFSARMRPYFRGTLTDARSFSEEETKIVESVLEPGEELIVKMCLTDFWSGFAKHLKVEDIPPQDYATMYYYVGYTDSNGRMHERMFDIDFDNAECGSRAIFSEAYYFCDRIDQSENLLKSKSIQAEIKNIYCLIGYNLQVLTYFATDNGDYILYKPYYMEEVEEYFFPVEVMYELADAWQAKVDEARERAKETGFNVSWGGEITELKDLSAYVVAPETWVLASTEKEGTDPSENTDVSTETGTDASAAQTEKTTGAAEDASKTGWIVAAVCAGVVVIAVIAAVLLRKKKA